MEFSFVGFQIYLCILPIPHFGHLLGLWFSIDFEHSLFVVGLPEFWCLTSTCHNRIFTNRCSTLHTCAWVDLSLFSLWTLIWFVGKFWCSKYVWLDNFFIVDNKLKDQFSFEQFLMNLYSAKGKSPDHYHSLNLCFIPLIIIPIFVDKRGGIPWLQWTNVV